MCFKQDYFEVLFQIEIEILVGIDANIYNFVVMVFFGLPLPLFG